MSNFGERIIVLIDMDCFFCQVETKLNPELKGKPLAVVQYGSFGPSAIIAVNYEARDYGVSRHMKGPEAKEKCPDIVLVTVPPVRNKPDTGRYRAAGREVIEVLKKYCSVIERASIDEAYLDITNLVQERMSSIRNRRDIVKGLEHTFVVGYCDDDSNDEEKRAEGVQRWIDEAFHDLGDTQARKLAIAGTIVEEFRAAIWSECAYRCSAGISYNKILAKLACGLHKPNRQTILPTAGVPGLYSSLPVNKVRNLGGKFGNIVMESLGCNVMADVLKYSLQDLQKRFDDKTGSWLYNIARGIDNEPVTNRLICKSIGSSKNFPGKAAITKLVDLRRWVGDLVDEMVERLEQDMEENERRATHLTIGYHWYQDKKIASQSKSSPLTSYKRDRIANLCIDVITKATQKPIAFIGMSAGKFVPIKGSGSFVNFFKAKAESSGKTSEGIEKSQVRERSEVEEESSEGPMLRVEASKMKTYARKNVDHDVEQNSHRDLPPQQEINDDDITLPQVTDAKAHLLSAGPPQTLDSEHFRNSFFMNFLKDSSSSVASCSTEDKKVEPRLSKKPGNLEIIESNSLGKEEVESPDLFDDCEEGPESKVDEDECLETFRDGERQDGRVEANKESAALAQLKDIFPNLDNIDMSVLQLLPIELQRAAHAYLKPSKTASSKTKNEGKTATKSKAKAKTNAGKVPPKNGIIKNFFVTNSVNSCNDSPKKQCPECNQMILLGRFQEHCDFHVAQNLQRMINNPSTEGEASGELSNSDSKSSKSPVVKRKSSDEMAQPSKKARSITSFFT